MQTVTIDLIPQKEKPIVKLSQYDNDRQVRFMLEENGETYTLAGTETVEVNIRKPDRNIVVIAPTIGANAYVDVLFTEQSAACFGESFGELSIKSGETVIGTCNFIIEVEISPIYGGIDSATEINNLETQIEEIITEVLSDDYYTKTETDDLLDAKADASDVYTKTQTDTLLNAKADASDVYTKTQTDTLLNAKADTSDVYTKTQTDSLLDAKADASDVYTKSQTDSLLNAKADASDVYTKTEVDNIILDIMPVDTASGPIASFDTEIAAPLVNVSCNVVATGGNGTPENPNPINGYTEANITRCGVNLFDKTKVENGYINDANGNFSPNADYWSSDYIPVKGGQTYYIKTDQTRRAWGAWYDVNKTYISGCTNYNITHEQTAPSNACYVRLTIMSEQDGNIDTFAVSYPSTDMAYHPYTGNTYTVSFGQTVYGGVLDVTRGKLHVTHYGVEYDGTENNWEWYGDYQQGYIALPYAGYYAGNDINFMCNNLKTVVADSRPQNIGNYASLLSSGLKAAFSTPETSLANFKTWLGSHHVQFVYELATPFDIDLTPEVISAVVGTNNVYSDTNGDTTVKFKDSIQHYIDNH